MSSRSLLNGNVKRSLDITPQLEPHTPNLMLNQFLLGLCCYGYRLDGQDGQNKKKKTQRDFIVATKVSMIQRSLRTLCCVFCQSFKNDVGSPVKEQSNSSNKLIFTMMTKPDSNTGAWGGEVVSFSTKKKPAC